jgi:hypothetical protein
MQKNNRTLQTILILSGCLCLGSGCSSLLEKRTEQATGQVTYSVAPGVSNTVAVLRSVADVVPLPAPAAPIVDLALTAILAGFGVWAKLRTTIARHRDEKAMLIDAIEESGNAEIKAKVAKRVASKSALGREVKERTK